MAVKAREEVRMREFSPFLMIGIGVVVIAYILLYDQFVNSIEDVVARNAIGVVCLAIMMTLFCVIVRYISTSFNLLLTHAKLTVERKILMWHSQVADIPTSTFKAIETLENYPGKPKGKNLTVGKISDMDKYVLTYAEGGETKTLRLQCSQKFYNEIKKLVESNTKTTKKK